MDQEENFQEDPRIQTPGEKIKKAFKNKNGKYSAIKVVGFPLLALVLLFIAFWFLNAFFSRNSGMSETSVSSFNAPSMRSQGISFEGYNTKTAYDSASAERPADAQAEGSYETTRYDVSIETKGVKKTCDEIKQIEEQFGGIFKDSRKSENACSFTFMVKDDRAKNVLAYLKQFNPENIIRHTEREEKLATRITSEIDILKAKLESVTQTLETAKTSYNSIISLSRNAVNIEGLNKAIQNKIDTIDRLTTKKIDITQNIQRTLRKKQNLEERFTHTYFSVSVTEDIFFDWDSLGENWQQATKDAVSDINETLQALTLGLLTFVLLVIKILLYIVIVCFFLLFLSRFGYRIVRALWREK